MKSNFNWMSCIGFLILIVGGVYFIAGSQSVGLGAAPVAPLYGLVILIIGLIVIIIPFRVAGRWNKVVGIVKSHKSITIQEAAGKSGVNPDKVRSIVYEGIASGDLSGSMEGDTFSRKKDGVTITTTQTAKVLVICPFCGSKTEQGLASCQKCGADL
jgi:hypothetical protein